MTIDLFILWCTFLPAATFTLVYGFTGPWWRYQEGQNVLALSAVVSLLVGRALVLRYTTEDVTDASTFLRVGVSLLAAVLWWRLWLLIKAKLDDRGGEQ